MARTRDAPEVDQRGSAWEWTRDFVFTHCVAVAPALALVAWTYRRHPNLPENIAFVLAMAALASAILSALAHWLAARSRASVLFLIGLLIGALWGGGASRFIFHLVDTGGVSGMFFGPVVLPYFGFLGAVHSATFTPVYAARRRRRALGLIRLLALGLLSALFAAALTLGVLLIELA